MKEKLVRYEVDLANLPPLSAEQEARFKALSEKPDSEIDLSDIPETDDTFWKNAIRNPFYKPTKTSTTVRIDSDVLYWLRLQGKGYQSRINAILRREMLAARSLSAKQAPAAEAPPTSPIQMP